MLRFRFPIALLLVFVLAGGYFYTTYQAVCDWPLPYRVGEADERFGLSEPEVIEAIEAAAAAWEDGVGQDLFVYDPAADFTINFIFDDRQELTESGKRARERLDAVESQSTDVQVAYEAQVADLTTREVAYETALATYERDLSRYNRTVASYNDEGGAPPEVFAELESERKRLAAAQDSLTADVAAINDLVAEINTLGQAGNTLISSLNERVDAFNTTFADGREFTQGDYQGGLINIYSFSDEAELYTVLVHELGHALGIDHVEEETAFMHFLLSEQDSLAALTEADIAAFTDVCSRDTRLMSVPEPFRTIFTWLGV